MKKILVIIAFLAVLISNAQTRGVKIGYINMDYILEKVPDYAESKNQLEQKAQKWKQEIELKKNDIEKLKEELKTEKALLTKELIEEREEEIAYQEKTLLEYQEKRFGASGDLMIQKTLLVKPIQDQVFTIIQDISEREKYDFIFDKSSDLTMLFANQKFDISEKVVRQLTRAQNREKLSKKQQDKEEALEDIEDKNPALAARRKAIEDRKLQREKLLEDRKNEREKLLEDRSKAADERKQKVAEDKEATKSGTIIENENKEEVTDNASKTKTADEKRQEIIEDRARKAEQRKKVLEERKKKILEDREKAKKEREQKQEENKKE